MKWLVAGALLAGGVAAGSVLAATPANAESAPDRVVYNDPQCGPIEMPMTPANKECLRSSMGLDPDPPPINIGPPYTPPPTVIVTTPLAPPTSPFCNTPMGLIPC
jgi:hypothetical protein